MPSFLSAEEELLISNTILIVISAISPMTSVRFTSLSHPISVSYPSNLVLSFVNVWVGKTQQLKILTYKS